MAGTQSHGGLRKRRRNGLGTVDQDEARSAKKVKATAPGREEPVASKAQKSHNVENANHGDAETHAARPHGDRTAPRAIKNASQAAMAVARILIKNSQRNKGEDLLETRVEDFNTIDHAENPAANEQCEEEELHISRDTPQRELAETQESEAKRGAEEEASNTTEQPEAHETNTKTSGRRDMPIQQKQARSSLLYPMARKPQNPTRKLKDIPIPSYSFRPPCIPCADLHARVLDDTETGHIYEKQGKTFLAMYHDEMPVLLRGISKLMSEANFYFHHANHTIPFAIAAGNGPVLPIGSERAGMSGLENMIKMVEVQEEEIRSLER
ncbi:hypothetical protein FDENT_7798 [Fusarium denticulatum]|uniref:Uncharacterized protein n=1 Tax=Fusarium denticulatum TaxID=48507 RepID=A0A8H5U4Y3_9HYPO|nr:hypothetical protein FDENT_7798 [Fusarium denticulatum]